MAGPMKEDLTPVGRRSANRPIVRYAIWITRLEVYPDISWVISSSGFPKGDAVIKKITRENGNGDSALEQIKELLTVCRGGGKDIPWRS